MIIRKFVKIQLIVFLFFLTTGFVSQSRNSLTTGFQTPPDSTKPALYWYWINEHVSKEGITKDLEAMAKVGIGEAFIGNIFEGGGEIGKVKTLGTHWKECMQHAIKEGTRLGVDISIFNAPGWSQSGGPWIKPEQSMRYLSHTSTTIKGGKQERLYLGKSGKDFQDVVLLAYPVNNEKLLKPNSVKVNLTTKNANYLFDTDRSTKCVFDNEKNDSIVIDITSDKPFLSRSLTIFPTGQSFNTTCKLFKRDGQSYTMVKEIFFDRSNTSKQLGPTPDGAMVITFPEEVAQSYRIVLTGLPKNFELADIQLSSNAKIEKITEKLLYKLPNTPAPSWGAYVWDDKAVSDQKDFVSTKDVINISSYLKNDTLTWKAPKGEWNIVRIGMVPTGTQNVPAAPNATGLELDKMSKAAFQTHFDAFVGNVMKGLTKDELKSLKRIIVDSYEVGPQNWTDNFREIFMKEMGYDPIPWLAVLTGNIVSSEEQSNRFLWDMRRVVANQIAEQYVGGMREIAHKNGLTIWLENYGHWGYPSEFLYYGSFSDNIGGEFWTGDSWDAFECRLASSACHIYGKNTVYAESYTSGGPSFAWSPKLVKRKGDWSYTEGINSVVLHVYIHQPYEDKTPGVNAWFGIEFNRKNTWFEQSKAWIDYQRRCCFMLQQGKPVNDICFFIGEDAPKMQGWVDKDMSKGYSYDFINADVIQNRLTVKDGKLSLPDGIQYKAMVLPPQETMRPELLKKIKELIEAGAVVVGSAPSYSPSLMNYPQCDTEVKKLVSEMWGNISNGEKSIKNIGKGKLYTNIPLNDVLRDLNVSENLSAKSSDLLWTHRTLNNGDIYFVTNKGKTTVEDNITFRVKNKQPELWDAVLGTNIKLKSFRNEGESTIVPIILEPGESCFITFLDDANQPTGALDMLANYPKMEIVTKIEGPWNIRFTNEWLKQDFTISTPTLFDWKTSTDERVKYFSGSATYTTNFNLKEISTSTPISLHFDNIETIGSIRINGKDVATLWTPPYKVDVTSFVQKGTNTLEVTVSNLWVNQLINQSKKDKSERTTWLVKETVKADQELLPSGIIGNVSIVKQAK